LLEISFDALHFMMTIFITIFSFHIA